MVFSETAFKKPTALRLLRCKDVTCKYSIYHKNHSSRGYVESRFPGIKNHSAADVQFAYGFRRVQYVLHYKT